MRVRPFVVALVAVLTAIGASAAIQLPTDLTVEASGPGGAAVQFNAIATSPTGGDDFNGRPNVAAVAANCSPSSGSTFAIGTTLVQCSGTTADGLSSSGSFRVTVVDTTAPALSLPRFVSAQAPTSAGAVVNFDASAVDLVDGPRAVVCAPASGSLFGVGLTAVTCSATDSRGNRASGELEVSVLGPQQPPPPPPTLSDVTAEATGPGGASVSFSVSGGTGTGPDDFNGRPSGGSVSCSPASGSVFAIGITLVSCSNGGSFNVIVRDTTAPSLSLPSSISAQADAGGTATVNFTASATDLVSGSVSVACTPASGSAFSVGTTSVSCSATDGAGNSASGSFDVTVTADNGGGGGGNGDTTPPVIAGITATPDTLRPPNNKLVTIHIEVEANDNADPAPVSSVFDVTGNELLDPSDWTITGPLTLQLRASRSGAGTGRVYTVWVQCVDAAGNRSVGTVTVQVPHDESEPQKGGW